MFSLIRLTIFTFMFLSFFSQAYSMEKIVIATGEYPPFASKTLKHDGFCSQLVKEAFNKEGYQVEFKFVPWKRALESTKLLKYDATSFWYQSAEKEKHFHYSDTILTEKTVFFHLKTTIVDKWDSLKDLSKYRIGATRSYTYTDEFWQLAKDGTLKVEEASSDTTNFKKLIKGRIDLFPSGIVVGYGILNKTFDSPILHLITYNPKVFRDVTAHVLFPKKGKKSEKLVNAFNKGLAKLKSEGTYQKFHDNLLEGKYNK